MTNPRSCKSPEDADSLHELSKESDERMIETSSTGTESYGLHRKLSFDQDVTVSVCDDVKRSDDVDGGWAWVVLVTSCVSLAIQDVIYSASGMFQVEFQAAFGGSRGFLALVGSLFLTFTGMMGPVSGMLSSVLTPRVTMMVGAALLFLAMELASICPNPTSLLLTFGIMGGVGNSLVFTPASTAFSGYFVKYRQVANGFITASPGIGTLTGPYLIRWLIHTQGWRFSMAVCGLLTAQICILGSLIFPHRGHTGVLEKIPAWCSSVCRSRKNTFRQSSEKFRTSNGGPLKDSGKALIDEAHTEENALRHSNNVTFRSRLGKVIRKKEMFIICVNQMLVMMAINIHHLHQPSYIRSVGLDVTQFPNLYLIFGVSLIVSRVTGGFVFTRFSRHLEAAIFVCEMTMALAMGLMPLYGKNLTALYFYNALIGLSWGPSFMLATPVLIDYIGVDSLPVAYGIMLLCCGTGSMVAASLAGLIYDFLGTYTVSFFLGGSLVAVGAMSLLLLLCVGNKKTKQPTSLNIDLEINK